MRTEKDVTHEALARLRENPNAHIANLSNQVNALSTKLHPMLDRVE